MGFATGLVIGLLIGATVGLVTFALMHAARSDDE